VTKIKQHYELDAKVAQNEIGALYDSKVWFYDVWAYFTESKARYRALELAKIHNNQSVLEVAVGTGLMFSDIVQRNSKGENIGIDISQGMLSKAKRRLSKQQNENYSLSIGSAFNLKVKDASIDMLVNNYMFDLIPFNQMDSVIDEFNRVLKQNGKLLLINMTKSERFGASLYENLYSLSPRLMGGCRGVQLTDLLTQHGFRIEVREYIQQMLFPSEVILAYK
jgi:ubiquinone/menaquinone biosynthesis C-methylase UbiE|tara:strand:+ start:1193 stop:1861 length:669 start_codon:yes stop_codon:yes gene_type:complete